MRVDHQYDCAIHSSFSSLIAHYSVRQLTYSLTFDII